MEATDIVEALNQYYEKLNNKGHFVVQKSIMPDATIKAYKVCTIIVWFINGRNKQRVVEVKRTVRMVTDKEETKINKELNIELTRSLFEYVNSNEFTLLNYGI